MIINKIQDRYYMKKQGYSDSLWHGGILRFVQLWLYSEPPKESERVFWFSVEASKIGIAPTLDFWKPWHTSANSSAGTFGELQRAP